METTSTIYSQPEIKAALQTSFAEVAELISNCPDDIFYQRKNDKWSIAENFDHLILSAKPLASGMKQPKIVFRVFGLAKKPSMSYNELVATYHAALVTGNPTNNPFLSDDIEATSKEKYLSNWNMIGGKFQERIELWSEKDLDKYRVVHPLLGKLTIREILFFDIYHNGHHLRTMKEILKK